MKKKFAKRTLYRIPAQFNDNVLLNVARIFCDSYILMFCGLTLDSNVFKSLLLLKTFENAPEIQKRNVINRSDYAHIKSSPSVFTTVKMKTRSTIKILKA